MTQQLTTKQRNERSTFQQLAALIDLSIDPDSIRQNAPPAPDVECVLASGSTFAAELVSLDSSATQVRINNTTNTKACWYDALKMWPHPQRLRLQEISRDLVLYCMFKNSAGRMDRREAFKEVQGALLQRPANWKGDLLAHLGQVKPKGLQRLRVDRSGHTGVRISAPTVGKLLEPDYAKLLQKLTQKNYKTTASVLHLFAYSDHDELDGHVDSLTRLKEIAREHLAASPFDAVHFFDASLMRHLSTVG